MRCQSWVGGQRGAGGTRHPPAAGLGARLRAGARVVFPGHLVFFTTGRNLWEPVGGVCTSCCPLSLSSPQEKAAVPVWFPFCASHNSSGVLFLF